MSEVKLNSQLNVKAASKIVHISSDGPNRKQVLMIDGKKVTCSNEMGARIMSQ